MPDPDLTRQRQVVNAFVTAARGGDLDALLAVLDPEAVLRADRGGVHHGGSRIVRGARTIAEQAIFFSRLVQSVKAVLVNGATGVVSWLPDGRPVSVMGFTIASGKIVEIDVLSDPARLRQLDLTILDK